MVLDFESQLELGEMLLRLGRFSEADIELRKAQELNEAEVYRTADAPDRDDQLDRLRIAFDQLDEKRLASNKRERLKWIVAICVLMMALIAAFTAWVFARNRITEIQADFSATAEAIGTRQFVFDNNERAMSAERTMFVERLREDNVRLTEAASVAELGQLAATQASEAMLRSAPIIVEPQLNPSYQGDMCGSAWHRLTGGTGQTSYLTLNRQIGSDGTITNDTRWTPVIPLGGRYKVEAFIANHPRFQWECPTITNIGGDTNTARYNVVHARGETLVIGDQFPLRDEYLNLGVFSFEVGSDGYIYLPDETVEPSATRFVSFGHIRLTWVGR